MRRKPWRKHDIHYMLFYIYDSIVNFENRAWCLEYLGHVLANGGIILITCLDQKFSVRIKIRSYWYYLMTKAIFQFASLPVLTSKNIKIELCFNIYYQSLALHEARNACSLRVDLQKIHQWPSSSFRCFQDIEPNTIEKQRF